ncbi:leucine-rich repeat domain-containing protein, partial [Eubacteriales bacterium DFI.9.88]|nr:leucine-rich repeat domain-containing protein [Eubacteriales bacterium DFI.9.88]
MKKKWISLVTSVMMFATILANPAIGAAAEKQSEVKDVQIKTVTSVEPTKAKEEKPEPSKASKATAQAASSKDIAVSEGVTGGNIYFDEATGTITGCDESVTGVVISSVINNVSVETIGESAFLGCSALTKVKLPDSVTVIEGYAFSECIKLEEVILPKNLE